MILRPGQVERLCGVESSLCLRVLHSLVESVFLRVRPDGDYGRATSEVQFTSTAAQSQRRRARDPDRRSVRVMNDDSTE
jgi:hypothetical protein